VARAQTFTHPAEQPNLEALLQPVVVQAIALIDLEIGLVATSMRDMEIYRQSLGRLELTRQKLLTDEL
jgi:hypothetical protein